jgi:hypothetical protein
MQIPLTMKTLTQMFAIIVFSLLGGGATQAQTAELLPEVDAYVKLNPTWRVYVQAKDTKEDAKPGQAEVGPSVQYYVNRFLASRRDKNEHIDDSKSTVLVVDAGYRYLFPSDSPAENRIRIDETFHLPTVGKLLISNRCREDLDWSEGEFTWRYRNRLTIERDEKIRSYKFTPYLAAEPYYESQYGKWSTTALYAGVILPLSRKIGFTPYYEHQNNTGGTSNKQLNGIGLLVELYFARH